MKKKDKIDFHRKFKENFTMRQKNIVFFIAGFSSSSILFFLLFCIFSTFSILFPRFPEKSPQNPHQEMIEFFGNPNVTAQKLPMNIWKIKDEVMLNKVKKAHKLGLVKLGRISKEFKIGDYLMFNSLNSSIWGFMANQKEVENMYILRER